MGKGRSTEEGEVTLAFVELLRKVADGAGVRALECE